MTGWFIIYQNAKPIKSAVKKVFVREKNSILELYDGAKKTLKGDLEGAAEKEYQEGEEDIDSTSHEHEKALKRAYRSFVIASTPKTDTDSYFDQTKPQIKTVINGVCKGNHDPMGKMEEAYNATH